MSLMGQSAIFLGAAVVAVPISRKLGLGALLGYLLAGIVIGPSVLGLIEEVDDLLHFAELGVVLLLFVIGLELKPSRLWAMRKPIFGLGASQLAVSTAALFALALAFGLSWQAALVIGMSLSLSSTAVALQMLAEKKQLTNMHGRAAFGVLLFQDLAIVPLMALVPLLAGTGDSDTNMALAATKAVLALVAVVVGGRYLLRPVFRAIAHTQVPEVFTAAALLVVVGTGLIMQAVGFSMAMGAFVAGVLLADSEYRHELEANIEPFKGLLLGLFFIAVGMSVNLSIIVSQPLVVIGLTMLLLSIKFCVLFMLGRGYGLDNIQSTRLGITIAQGGEFAFVLFGLAQSNTILAKDVADLLILVVTISMMLTPIVVTLLDLLVFGKKSEPVPAFDAMENEENRIIIAGFGRFGQIIGRLLRVRKIPFTALDASPSHVDFVRNFGNKIYYGDVQRLDLLRAAGAADADVLVVALDDMQATNRVVQLVSKHWPDLKLFVRARNRQHVYELMDLGVKNIVRETFLSSLDMGEDVLRALGVPISTASETVARFKTYDRELLKHQHSIYKDPEKIIASGRHSRLQLEELFEKDAEALVAEISEIKP